MTAAPELDLEAEIAAAQGPIVIPAPILIPELEDLTPAKCDEISRKIFNAVAHAQSALRLARKQEVKKKRLHKRARVRLTLAGDCPKVARNGYTTAERDAWVDQKSDSEEFAYEVAKVERESCQDYVAGLRDQGMLIATLGKSVQQAYGMAGRVER